MLVLTRRPGEAIMIGGDVVVRVVEVRGDQVRIGIDAPRSLRIFREEVFHEVERENARAAESSRRAAAFVARRPRPEAEGQRPDAP